MLRSFLKYVPSDKRNNFAVSGWSAMIVFAQAARAVVEKDGVNGLTRKALLETGIPTLTKFNTEGMTGTDQHRGADRDAVLHHARGEERASSCGSTRRRRARSTARRATG